MSRTLATRLTLPALAATMLLGAWALPAAAADFITSDRTLANGNEMKSSYSGQAILVGASGIFNGEVTRVGNVRVDIVAPAQLNFSDATGGSLALYSNSVVRMTGGSAGTPSSFANVGRFTAYDTSQLEVSGGSLSGITLNGTSAGAAGARATVSGGILQSSAGIVAYGTNGTLNVSGGTVQSTSGSAVYIHMNSAFTMTGGTATGGPGGVAQWGVRLEGTSETANLQGGTVNGGMRTSAAFNQTALQATLGGSLMVNGGVFAHSNAAINVTGGSYTRFAGADASFFTMGSNSINFFGTDLALSGPTAGSVFELNNYIGNFYTFTGGTFSDGQSAIGLRLFDATSVAGNVLGGGFTLNPSAVPEPSTWLLMTLALPAIGAAVRRRTRA